MLNKLGPYHIALQAADHALSLDDKDTLIETAKLNGLDPLWLRLER